MYVHFCKIDGYDPEKLQQLWRIEFHVILIWGGRGMNFKCVSVHTKVPLMLQDTAGFGEPSTSQINIFCWPSSLISFRPLILGAPATAQKPFRYFWTYRKDFIMVVFTTSFLISKPQFFFFFYIERLLQLKFLLLEPFVFAVSCSSAQSTCSPTCCCQLSVSCMMAERSDFPWTFDSKRQSLQFKKVSSTRNTPLFFK